MGDRDFGRESGGKHGVRLVASGCHFVFALTCDEWRGWMEAGEHPGLDSVNKIVKAGFYS